MSDGLLITSRQTGADDASVTPRSRSIQVGEFEVAIPGGIWVAIGASWANLGQDGLPIQKETFQP